MLYPAIIIAVAALVTAPQGDGRVVFNPKSTASLPRAVRVGDTAYQVGKPRVLISADVDDVKVSPDRRFVLAICRTPRREPFDTLLGAYGNIAADFLSTIPAVRFRARERFHWCFGIRRGIKFRCCGSAKPSPTSRYN